MTFSIKFNLSFCLPAKVRVSVQKRKMRRGAGPLGTREGSIPGRAQAPTENLTCPDLLLRVNFKCALTPRLAHDGVRRPLLVT